MKCWHGPRSNLLNFGVLDSGATLNFDRAKIAEFKGQAALTRKQLTMLNMLSPYTYRCKSQYVGKISYWAEVCALRSFLVAACFRHHHNTKYPKTRIFSLSLLTFNNVRYRLTIYSIMFEYCHLKFWIVQWIDFFFFFAELRFLGC